MNELTRFGALSAQRIEAALLRGNTVTERFGLTLTPEQCGRLLARRAEALRETERIELGEGILPKLAVALCDSPCVGPENWEEALGGLTELFYHFKGACGEHLSDDELLAALVTLWASKLVVPVLPYLLSFAAGAMIYVVVEELIPESQSNERKDVMALFTLIGFVIMMLLDVALG